MRKLEREPNGPGIFRTGEDLVILGSVGKRGARTALSLREAELRSRFSGRFLKRARAQAEQKLSVTSSDLASWGATEWEPVEEGGVLAALWNLSGAYLQGISFSLPMIPVSQEIVELCEYFDLNPYRLSSGECLLAAAENGGALVLAAEEAGILAAVIGRAEPGIARRMYGLGTTGYLERPQPDEIEKLMQG